MSEDRWADLERRVTMHLKMACTGRWRKRMSYAQRVEAVRESLREGCDLGFVLRWSGRQVKPRRPARISALGETCHAVLPRGGYYASLVVRSGGISAHYLRILIIFR